MASVSSEASAATAKPPVRKSAAAIPARRRVKIMAVLSRQFLATFLAYGKQSLFLYVRGARLRIHRVELLFFLLAIVERNSVLHPVRRRRVLQEVIKELLH